MKWAMGGSWEHSIGKGPEQLAWGAVCCVSQAVRCPVGVQDVQ